MQGIWDVHLGWRDAQMLRSGRQALFYCFWWLSRTSVQTILKIDETSFLCSRFSSPGATLQSHQDYFWAFNSSSQDFNTSLKLQHIKPASTSNINIDIEDNKNVSILASKVSWNLNHPKQSGRQDVRKRLDQSLSNFNKIWIQERLNIEIRNTDDTALTPSMLPWFTSNPLEN